MKWFYNLKIGVKLITAFILVAMIAGVVGVLGIAEISSTDKNYSALYDNYGVSLGYLTNLTDAYQRIRVNLRNMMLDKNDGNKQNYLAKVKNFEKIVSDNMEKFSSTAQLPEEKAASEELKTALDAYEPVKTKVVELTLTHQEEQAFAYATGEGAAVSQKVDDAISKNVDLNDRMGKKLSDQYTKSTQNVILMMLIIIALAMAAAIGLGLLISRIIGKPVKSLVIVAEKIAEGDLNVNIENNTKDEVGVLSRAFSRMVDNLNEVMTQISAAAEQVASGSRQVSQSSMALSQGATEQASSIEELTASIEEIASQTRNNANNANQANALASEVKDNAARGNAQMGDMLKAMEEINDSSANISKIIKVIDEIAFQTNILALNAAVEAARAGQHGKGFAVVAEEVRNLAARSANAAKETTAMIEGSIKKVEGGTRIANDTATALNKIVDGIAKAASIVGDIAIASNEQATGIAQVNQGIMQVSTVVQTNSATSEESAAASEELSSQAELLREQVSKFKLRKNTGAYAKFDGLSPDMLKMLENMSARKPVHEATVIAKKITLDGGGDFGKY